MSRLVTLIVLASIVGCTNQTPLPPIVIGHVSNATGTSSAELGIRLALEETRPTTDDASRSRSLIVRHTSAGGSLDAMEAQAARLAAVHKAVALVGGSNPEDVSRLERTHLPLVTFAGQAVPGSDGLVFSLGMMPEQQGRALADYAAKDLKLNRIIIVADERRGAVSPAADVFARKFARHRQAAKDEPAAPIMLRFGKEPRWDELARRIEKEQPAGLCFAGRARDFRDLVGELKRPLPALIFAGDDGDEQTLDVGRVYFATAFSPDATKEAKNFVTNYRAAYNNSEPDVFAALGYDALRLLEEAVRKTPDDLTPEALRAALAATGERVGATGPFTILANRQTRRALTVARRDGAAVTTLVRYRFDDEP